MLYQMKEWEDINGKWHCNCVDDLGGNAGLWYVPARILGISPAEYIKLVIETYKPDDVYFNKENCLCFWSWTNQVNMRKFKNMINATARKKNFQI